MKTLGTLTTRRVRALGWVVGLLTLILFPDVAACQPALFQPPPLETHAFRNFLHGFGLQPLGDLDELLSNKEGECVLIVFGDLACLDARKGRGGGFGLKEFVDSGGAVLIASDQPDERRLGGPFSDAAMPR